MMSVVICHMYNEEIQKRKRKTKRFMLSFETLNWLKFSRAVYKMIGLIYYRSIKGSKLIPEISQFSFILMIK